MAYTFCRIEVRYYPITNNIPNIRTCGINLNSSSWIIDKTLNYAYQQINETGVDHISSHPYGQTHISNLRDFNCIVSNVATEDADAVLTIDNRAKFLYCLESESYQGVYVYTDSLSNPTTVLNENGISSFGSSSTGFTWTWNACANFTITKNQDGTFTVTGTDIMDDTTQHSFLFTHINNNDKTLNDNLAYTPTKLNLFRFDNKDQTVNERLYAWQFAWIEPNTKMALYTKTLNESEFDNNSFYDSTGNPIDLSTLSIPLEYLTHSGNELQFKYINATTYTFAYRLKNKDILPRCYIITDGSVTSNLRIYDEKGYDTGYLVDTVDYMTNPITFSTKCSDPFDVY